MYLQKFKTEIEEIIDDRFREFAVDAIATIEDDYFSETDVKIIKYTIMYLRRMLQIVDADDIVFDIFNVAGLLYLSCKWDTGLPDTLHMLKVRAKFSSLQSIIGREQYNNILLIIESQEGLQSPIPQVEPRPEDPVYNWILTFAIQFARDEVAL